MEWVWPLYEKYVTGTLVRLGSHEPSDDALETAFFRILGESTVTVLVQEPWRGSVRFKCLDVLDAATMFELLSGPEPYLERRYGGGKFKLNFHHGLSFVATRNFKPAGEPLWADLPEFEPGHAA